MWKLSPDTADQPLFRRITSLVEANIDAGRLQPGDRLPPERVLAARLGVNRSTVTRAMDALAERGIVIRRQGSGIRVNPEKWGVQSYPLVNWREQPIRAAERSRVSSRRPEGDSRMADLAGDDLPPDLLPDLSPPGLSWRDLVRAERDEEASRPGLPLLRRSVAAHLGRLGLAADPADILITSGTRQAIFLLTQSLLRPGDAIGVEAPSYYYSLPLFQAAGLRLFALPTDNQGVVPEGLEAVHERHPLKMLFLNPIFHNPTGTVMSHSRKRAILDLCADRRLPVVEDDAYSGLAFDPLVDTSPLKSLDSRDGVLLAGSLTSYAGSSLRAGWLLAPRPVVGRLAHIRSQMDSGLSALPQVLAATYLDEVHTGHVDRLRKILRERRDLLLRMLAPLADRLVLEIPRGGFYLYARLRDRSPAACAAFEYDLRAAGPVPAPGTDFGDSQGAYRFNFARLSPGLIS